jgi:hypothetical protein
MPSLGFRTDRFGYNGLSDARMCNDKPPPLHIKCVVMNIELSDAALVSQIGFGSDLEAEAELFRRMARAFVSNGYFT